jgi:uncharacterized protein YciI
MIRALLMAALLPCWALTQSAAPAGLFLLRMEPVRSGFTLQNMTAEETQLANQHFAHLQKLFADGKLTYAAQVFDPKGLWGIVVVNAADLESAQAILNSDPGVKAGLFRGEAIPIRVVLERGTPPAPAQR